MRWHHIVQLKDQEGDVFYNKLTFAFLELGKFEKALKDCTSHLEKWCYMLRNLDGLEQIPDALKNDELVRGAFDEAKLLGMSKTEQLSYEQSLKIYRDLTNVVDTAYDDGVAAMQKKLQEETRQKEEAQREKEVAQRREEEAQRDKETFHKAALNALIAAGLSEEEARNQLNL